MLCNDPGSSYQLMIDTSDDSNSSSLKGGEETQKDLPTETQNDTQKEESQENEGNFGQKVGATTDQDLDEFKKVYNTLDVSSLSNIEYTTIKTIVVSQTWLTGWIHQLYRIEDDIVSTTKKPIR